ncbi:uncharacterized protein LOC114356910 [Ostrinia furnacalis]|uniref:uncharacterized protein LOC114356910 n=1 Tax=Ostrinia furnacalis TaxID=93504 RepID=UPI00103CDA94|nr:uncharacterized protein LOC114356910 [Ostrinia furnacalis]
MMGLLVRVALAVIVLNQVLLPCLALGSYRGYSSYGSSRYNSRQSKEASANTYLGTSSGLPFEEAPRRGLGISAWGIVAVVISLILAGMGLYYFAMCYPILCKKERKYDMMGLPSVA